MGMEIKASIMCMQYRHRTGMTLQHAIILAKLIHRFPGAFEE